MLAQRFVTTLLILILSVSACATPPSPRPTSAAPTAAAQSTRETKSYPPRPTATPFAAGLKEQPGIYTNADLGITLRYPDNWMMAPPDKGSNVLQFFVDSHSHVFAGILANLTSGDSLEATATAARNVVLSGLQDIQVLDSKAITLDDGRDAWTSSATGKRQDGSTLKIRVAVALYSGRAYALFVAGDPAAFDEAQPEVNQLISALHLEEPKLYGIPRDQALVLAGGESKNPREYDPATTHGNGDKLIFSGLVSFDPKMNLVPELAGSWKTDTAGVVYTFHLRPDARFHNGKPVTAQDVIYSWERAADPKTKSDTVLTYLGDIVGVKEMHAGTADHISGLKAIDDHTLQVTIDAPKPYFLQKLTFPTAFVLDRDNVESGPEWYRAPNGTGPYRLARWDSFKSLLYERNDDFYLDPPKIPYVIVQLFSGVPLRLYESGAIDVSGVGGRDLARYTDPKEPMHAELLNNVDLCTGFIIFDNQQPPFDDPKVRQAFTLAFDREKYIDVVLDGNALPAQGVFPPGLPGYNLDLKGLPYDPERARELLAESKYGGPGQLPPIVYTDSGTGSEIGGGVAALAQMWQKNLGVTITVENLEPDKADDLLYAGQHGQIFDGGWCADYPDPENFADILFHTGVQQNLGHYSNPQVDTLLEQARTERNVNKRIQLYQQAEQLIVDDAPVLFTTHGLSHVLVKPYIQGYVLTPIDVPLVRYLSIDASKLK